MKSVYLNANLIYGECLKIVSTRSWKRKIKTGDLDKIRIKGYTLFTSILTRMEVMQRLVREENKTYSEARKTYFKILDRYNINELCGLNKKNLLTNTFIDLIGRSNLDFKDALHLKIASRLKLSVVTHDKKFRKNFSLQEDKIKFYSKIYKPEELFLDD